MMREVKSSGIAWIGTIPKCWETDKLKYHLRRNEPRNPGDVVVLSLYRELGVIPKDSRDDNHNVTSEDTSKYKYVRPGDFVINKMKAWQGSVAVSEYEGIVSPAYFVYEFTDDAIFKRYFHYLLRSCYKDEFMRLSGGIRVGQWDLPADALENTPILIPPMDEQRRIADFLDAKCAEIDALTADIQTQIDTLEQYKRSVITETVTKGLNPTVVAESGRITYTFTIQNTGNTPVTATDDVILRDTFDPVLNGLTVTYNGAPWTAGTQYTYDGTTGLFATTAGQITVPAATYTQDPVTGAWAVTPGVSELIVTGTV